MAGRHGGELVVNGPIDTVIAHPSSLTARYLRGELRVPTPAARRPALNGSIRVRGATQHNLSRVV